MPLNKVTAELIKDGSIGKGSIAYNATGPYFGDNNLLPNPTFSVRQGLSYPLSVTGGGAYVADQVAWNYNGTGVTRTATFNDNISANVYGADANTAIHTASWMNFTQSGTSASSTYNDIVFLLNPLRLMPDGTPFTFSFYAKSSTSTTLPSVYLYVNNSSANITQNLATNVSLTTNWVRYSYTGTYPAISGTTRYSGSGWANGGYTTCSYIQLAIRLPFANGNVAANVDISTVQFEPGSVATPPVRRTYMESLDLCRYFYYISPAALTLVGYDDGSAGAYDSIILPMTMRTSPSCSNNWTGGTNFSAGTIDAVDSSMVQLKVAGTAVGMCSGTYNANNTFNSRLI